MSIATLGALLHPSGMIYRMMSSTHNRYNLLFRQTHEMQTIHHFALLLFKNYLTIQVGTLERIHRQYIRYESALDDTLISIENLNSGYLPHCILDPQVLTKYLEIIEDDLEDTGPEYEPVRTSVYQYYGNSLVPIVSFMGREKSHMKNIRIKEMQHQ